jgi:outer membrane biosynthesis protein TonB
VQRLAACAIVPAALMTTLAVTFSGSAAAADAADPLQAAPMLRIETGGHAAPVRRLAVDEARGIVVTASDDKTARVWDLRAGRAGLVLRPPLGTGDIGRLYGAAVHPSQPLVAVGGTSAAAGQRGALYLFDLDSGRLLRALDAGVGEVKRLAWSADGSVLLAAYADAGARGAGAVRAFAIDGRLLHDEPTSGAVYGLAAGARGGVAATDFAGRVVLLRAADAAARRVGTVNVQAREPIGVAFSPDEQSLLVGYNRPLTEPEVIDAASGRVLRQLKPQGASEGQFGVVAWSRDGQTMAAGGSASAGGRRFPVWVFGAGNAGDAQPRSVEVADNSVLDLTVLADGRLAFAAADGSWGVLGRGAVDLRVAGEVNDLRGAGSLQASGDLRRIGWAYGFGSKRASFDLAARVVSGTRPGLNAALTRRAAGDAPLQAGFDAQGAARKRQTAEVNGVTITFSGVELASCGTYLHRSRDAILGTSKALYRIDGQGRTLWRLPTAAEVNAVVASDDDRLLVTAMADGLIQWRRASDGAELLSLLVRPDGRWIVWTPEGYFDASPGADTLAGWVVNRGAGNAAELFSLGRFRDRYHRPDVIDAVLETLDTRAAIALAPPSMRASLLAAAPAALSFAVKAAAGVSTTTPLEAAPAAAEGKAANEPQAPIEEPKVPATEAKTTAAPAEPSPSAASAAPTSPAPPAPPAPPATAAAPAAPAPGPVPAPGPAPAAALANAPPSVDEFPPSLVALGTRKLTTGGASLQIPFALRATHGGRPPQLELRVDGRPLPPSGVQLPARMDGKTQGLITFSVQAGASTVVLLARDAAGVSEPLSFELEAAAASTSPAAPVPAPTPSAGPTAPASPAPTPTPTPTAATATPTAATKAPAPAATTVAPQAPATAAAPAAAPVADATPAKPPLATASPPAPAGRRLFVLAVGISDYERKAYRLGLPAKDATDFAQIMAAQKGVYQAVTTRLLTNARANRAAIEEGLKWLVESVGPGDVAMLFLAGHGINKDDGQYYFLNYEAQHERLEETALSERDIRDALRSIRGRTLFFVDTCFSGNVIGDVRTSSRELSRMANTLASAENGVVVFAASSGRQESEEKAAWGNGAFTKVLVEGLRGRADLNRSGRITFKGLDFYVSEEVRQLTQERQTPVTIIPVGVPDFVVAAPS